VRSFTPWASSAMDVTKETKIWHKGSLRDEDDTQTLNTHIVQRKHPIPHSTMKNNSRNIIKCCNNTQQGAPHTSNSSTCTSALGDASHVTCINDRH